ncbi:MAG: hypothetical protein ACLTY2_01315 [Coprococcus eutactus]
MKKYIFGFLTGICLLPIIDSITELIQTALEIPKGELSKKVLKLNNEIQDLQFALEPIDTHCIGFEAPSNEEYLDDENEEEDHKNKIGF